MIGETFGPYEITAKLGQGGMGEVYRAHDGHLQRDVAIKVLPPALSEDPERLARFDREARLLAQLSHPNIAAIFGVQEIDGSRALVMELVEGPTLAERLASGPMSGDEALSIARQIAEALEEAHDKGIVHRDLKPQNVKVSEEGRVKVLDFGLAKAFGPAGPRSDGGTAVASSPTLTMEGTAEGIILGSAAYMAPEQAKGVAVDKRADIWAFGVVLWEMLSGRRLFDAESVPETLAEVLKAPIDLEELPPDTPPALRRLLRRCLERNPRNRLHDIADARIVLDDLVAGRLAEAPLAASAATAEDRLRSGSRPVLASLLVFAALVVALAGGYLLGQRGAGPEPRPVHFGFAIDPAAPVLTFSAPPLALAPDGSRVLYVGAGGSGAESSRLYLRDLDRDGPSPIPDTEGADGPIFSPDGTAIAYAKDGWLVSRVLPAGAPKRLASVFDQAAWRGASWGPDGSIVFASSWFSPLFVVSASGGEPRQITELAAGEKSHRYPRFLPDGSSVLFVSSTGDISTFDEANVELVDLETGERKVLVEGGGGARFLPPSTLLVPRDGHLLAFPFDPERREVIGAPRRVLDDLVTAPTYGTPSFDVTAGGDLAYIAGDPDLFSTRVGHVSPEGDVRILSIPPAPYNIARPSPDGNRIAMKVDGANGQIWVFDRERETMTRISGRWDADYPAWGPEGEDLYYVLTEGGTSWIVRSRSDGGGGVERLLRGRGPAHLQTSDDGTVLVYVDLEGSTGTSDIFWANLPGIEESVPFAETEANELHPAPSPDGRLLAYASDASGRFEVYVQSFPEPGRRHQISSSGGIAPFWSTDGRTLYYREGRTLMAAEVTRSDPFRTERARALVDVPDLQSMGWPLMRAVPEGEGFLTLVLGESWEPADEIRVILDWRAELKRGR